MKVYLKIGLTVILMAMFLLLSGFRAQTIIHDDGSETQDVLKVSDTAEGQKELRTDADEFQKRNYTIMDYNNSNGTGFRAMKTITKDGASKSSVDKIVHKTHDGLICSTYYIDFSYDEDSIQKLRLGTAMPENDVDLEYIVSFPAGTKVVSNSTKADDQGSTYMWRLRDSKPSTITLQATVWHKLFIYIALFIVVIVLLIVVFMEHRRKSAISWKRAAHMRKIEMLLLCVPAIILGYMGYEYYVGTHITASALEQVEEQRQEELLESREEDRRLHDVNAQKQRIGQAAADKIRTETSRISGELRAVNRKYMSGEISQGSARSEARKLVTQAQELMKNSADLSQADREVLQQLIDNLVSEADSVGSTPAAGSTEKRQANASEEQRKEDADAREKNRNNTRNDDRASADAARDDEADTEVTESAKSGRSDESATMDAEKETRKSAK